MLPLGIDGKLPRETMGVVFCIEIRSRGCHLLPILIQETPPDIVRVIVVSDAVEHIASVEPGVRVVCPKGLH